MVIDDAKRQQHFWEGKGDSGGSGGIEIDHLLRQRAGEMFAGCFASSNSHPVKDCSRVLRVGCDDLFN